MLGKESGPKSGGPGPNYSLKGILRNPRLKVCFWPEGSCSELEGRLQIAVWDYNNLRQREQFGSPACVVGEGDRRVGIGPLIYCQVWLRSAQELGLSLQPPRSCGQCGTKAH